MVAILAGMASSNAVAQVANDTIYNPKVIFTGMPKKYEIAGLKVTGVDNYEDYIVIGYSGLSLGQVVEIPGNDITNAAKRIWRQGLFSKVKINVEKVYDNKAWLEFELRQQPRISQINYNGMKKGEREDLQQRLGLMKGNQMNPNIADRAKLIVQGYFDNKGFKNAEVNIVQREDLSNENEVIVDINVDKHEKIKVHKIYVEGNEVLSDRTVKHAMKKTNEKWDLIRLFSQKKFVPKDFEDDKQLIIDKYNEKGYRDAVIVKDSVVNFDEKTVDVYLTIDEGKQYFIRDITWVGNTVYPSDFLNSVLGFEKGDVYNQKLLNKRTKEDDDAIEDRKSTRLNSSH